MNDKERRAEFRGRLDSVVNKVLDRNDPKSLDKALGRLGTAPPEFTWRMVAVTETIEAAPPAERFQVGSECLTKMFERERQKQDSEDGPTGPQPLPRVLIDALKDLIAARSALINTRKAPPQIIEAFRDAGKQTAFIVEDIPNEFIRLLTMESQRGDHLKDVVDVAKTVLAELEGDVAAGVYKIF